jgi:hypothetical protein
MKKQLFKMSHFHKWFLVTLALIGLVTVVFAVPGGRDAASPERVDVLLTPTLSWQLPSGSISPTAGIFDVQIQVNEATNLAGFEFDVQYDPEYVSVVGITLSEFVGRINGCAPLSERCAVALSQGTAVGQNSIGAYSYGNDVGTDGDGILATIHLLPTGKTGTTSLRLEHALLVDVGVTNIARPQMLEAAITIGGQVIYLPVVNQNAAVGARGVNRANNNPLNSNHGNQFSSWGGSALFSQANSREPGSFTGMNPDVNLDTAVDVVDLQLAAACWNESSGTGGCSPDYDLNGDGTINDPDLILIANRWRQSPTTIASSSPEIKDVDVAVTRESVVVFTRGLDASAINSTNFFAQFAGNNLTGWRNLSPDGRRATLFYDEDLPPSARIQLTVNGETMEDAEGYAVDPDGDNLPGGVQVIDFDTLNLTAVVGTTVCGHVYASDLAVNQNGNLVDEPLVGATISVDGAADTLFAITDINGDFCLDPAPAGRFFIHVDGRTATNNVPPGAYYPFVGKAWESAPGQTVDIGNVYLPLVVPDTLQPVSDTSDTTIHFPQSVIDEHPEFADVMIEVPANSLFADDGSFGGSVGIAPVPPDRLPGVLPDFLNFALVITVQTDGPTNFNTPAPVCFPNLPDPVTGEQLAPDAKSSLFSFNHDTGKWGINGTMTVSEDGALVCTDEGSGIVAPGWHSSQPGSEGDSDSGPTPNDCSNDTQPGEGGCPDNPNDAYKAMNQKKIGGGMGTAECVTGNIACQLVCKAVTGGFIGNQICKKLGCGGSPIDACGDEFEKAKAQKASAEECFLNSLGRPSTQLHQFTTDQTSSFDDAVNAVLDTLYSDVDAYFELEDQIDILIGDATSEGDLTAEEIAQLEVLGMQWETLLDYQEPYEYFPQYSTQLEALAEQLDKDDLFPYDRAYYSLERFNEDGEITPPIQRGLTKAHGRISGLILGPDTVYRLRWYVPEFQLFSEVEFISAESGVPVTRMPRGGLTLDHSPDVDGDGLTELAEAVIGTSDINPDTDGDGIPDGAEVAQGTNPLDGIAVVTGILSSLELGSSAYDVCVADDLAVIALQEAGIALVDISDPFNPIVASQVDTPGSALQVACAGGTVAVADNEAGVALVNISDPSNPTITSQLSIHGEVRVITANDVVAYAGNQDGRIIKFSLDNGEILDAFNVGHPFSDYGQPFYDLQVSPEALYVYTPWDIYSGRLYTFALGERLSVADIDSVPSGVVNGPLQPALRLFIDRGIAYVVHLSGYDTFDLSDPLNPALIAAGDTFPQRGWRHIVPNGSGLGVAAAGVNYTDPRQVWLYDVRDPAETNQFITEYVTPGNANALAIQNGLAYVADGQAGLQVVNYQSFDSFGNAPAITITTNLTGTSMVEGQSLHVHAQVADDVQVTTVEFYVDDQQPLIDGMSPFSFQFVAPTLSQQTAISITAKAIDTGGNQAWADPVVLTLLPDITPPQVALVSPAVIGRHPITSPVSSLSVNFTEPVDPDTLTNATFQLFSAGTDGVVGTGDDVLVSDGAITYHEVLNMAELNFPSPLGVDLYQGVLTIGVTDRAGNPLSTAYEWTFRVTDFDFGPTLNFNGPAYDDYVSVPDDDTLDFGDGNFTLEAWVKTTETEEGSRILSKLNPGGNYYLIAYYPDGHVRIQISDGDILNAESPQPINDGFWHHIAGVRDGSTMLLYLDGVLAGSDENPDVGSIDNSGAFHIGNLAGWFNNYFNGQIDEVRVWNVARTPEEIYANMFVTLNGDETGLMGYWQFNEGTGATVADTTANGNDGTIAYPNNPVWLIHSWYNHPW